jgi:hypothetical protein
MRHSSERQRASRAVVRHVITAGAALGACLAILGGAAPVSRSGSRRTRAGPRTNSVRPLDVELVPAARAGGVDVVLSRDWGVFGFSG